MPENNDIKTRAEEWLEKEGYSLEFLTATTFQRHGFRIFQSDHIRDYENDILREVDVSAALTKDVDGSLLRIKHIVECKWSNDKPWVVFCSDSSRIHPGACIAQTIGSDLGSALLWHMAGDEVLYNTSHFCTPEEPGFAGRQVFSNGKDLFYSAMQSVTSTSILSARRFNDNESLILPRLGEIVFPLIVVKGKLFRATFDEQYEKIVLEEENHIRSHWRGAENWNLHCSVDIVTSDFLEEFIKIRKNERDLLFSSMHESLLNIKECFKAQSLDPLNLKRAPRGYSGLPKILRQFEKRHLE